MQGFDTLWLPGMDHAGIATQAKVEERLRGEGITRYDLGREKFLDKVWEWKDEYATTIKEQWGKMGLSVDYSRERFTLDEGLSKGRSQGLCGPLQERLGSTVVSLSSTGTQQLAQPFLISRSFPRMSKVPSTT